jgi:predicted dehydrogenase
MFNPVRIAVIGLGNFGRLHALTLAALVEAELVGVVDLRREALDAIQTRLPDVPAWTQLEQALRECDAEAWIVASTTVSHAQVAKALLAMGHHVLIEKPIAESLAQAEELAPWVAPDSGNLMLGHILVFNSEFQQLCDEAQKRGPIIYIDCVRHRPVTLVRLFPGESPFRLTMVHDLYSVLMLMQGAEPQRCAAQIHRNMAGECDLAAAQLQWDNGVIANLTASFLTPAGMPDDGFDRCEVFGQGWAARMAPNPHPFQLWDDRVHFPLNAAIRFTSDSVSGMLAEELRCFCRVVRGQQKVPQGATYAAAMQVQRLIDRLEAAVHPS